MQSARVLSSNGCGPDTTVSGGRIVGVRGRERDRVNHGRLGPKGLHGAAPVVEVPSRCCSSTTCARRTSRRTPPRSPA